MDQQTTLHRAVARDRERQLQEHLRHAQTPDLPVRPAHRARRWSPVRLGQRPELLRRRPRHGRVAAARG